MSDPKDKTGYAEFKKPPVFLKEQEEQIESAIERFKRRKIDLDVDEMDALELEITAIINDHEDANSNLRQKLSDLNDLFEAVQTETDFPWVGASSLEIPMGKIKGREIVSVINRTTMRPVPFAVTTYAGPASLYQDSKDFVKVLEDFNEDKIKNDTNIHETLKMALPPIYRDGTSVVQLMWESEYERVCDYKVYKDQVEFAKDYPSGEDAGIDQKKWGDIVDSLSKGESYEIRYEYDIPTYDGPKAYLVHLLDFVHWPVYVSELKDTLCHGKRVWYTDYQLKIKANSGLFDETQIKEITDGFGDTHDDTLASERDAIEGMNRNTNKQGSKEHEVFELVYRGPVTQEDKDENRFRKYLIYYHKKSKKILRVEHYPIRKGALSYFVLRFLKRDGRLLGISLLDDIADLCLEVNIQHRQRINSRTITHVPSFKAKISAKGYFDPSRREFRFRPGATYYLNDPINDVMQFDIRPVDLSGSVDDELLLFQLIDMTTGSTSGFSGQSNPIDPRAPARKQQEMLRQAGNRLDDYVNNLIPEFSAICQFNIDLHYQFGPDRIKFYAKSQDGYLVEQGIDRTQLFDPHVKFKINGSNVFMNADDEFDRSIEMEQMVANNPILAQNPRVRKESWERVVLSSRVQDPSSYIPTEKELPTGLTNSTEREIEAKAASSREKMFARATGDDAKREHEKEMELIKAAANQETPPEVPVGA